MSSKRIWALIVSFVFLLALDFGSKQAALAWIPHVEWGVGYPYGGIGIFSQGITFSLNTAFNTGAAWGIFSGYSGLLFVFRILVISFLIGYLIQRRETKPPLWLIATGAIGNVIDYSLYGFVIDFLHVTFWGYTFPIFNLADSYITIGALWLFLTPRRHANSHFKSQK